MEAFNVGVLRNTSYNPLPTTPNPKSPIVNVFVFCCLSGFSVIVLMNIFLNQVV
jgi:hypothetical protein